MYIEGRFRSEAVSNAIAWIKSTCGPPTKLCMSTPADAIRREPAFVFLLHASRLNAASIDAFAMILRDAKLQVVPLDFTMRDPAYRTADQDIVPDGNEWLERWAVTLHSDLPFDTIPEVPADIFERDARLEATANLPSNTPAPRQMVEGKHDIVFRDPFFPNGGSQHEQGTGVGDVKIGLSDRNWVSAAQLHQSLNSTGHR